MIVWKQMRYLARPTFHFTSAQTVLIGADACWQFETLGM